jgi:hypothetical protein
MVKSNAYGALKEIKYLWGLTPSNSIEIDYGGFKVKADHPLFDTVFVIGSISRKGTVVGHLDDLLILVADGLIFKLVRKSV